MGHDYGIVIETLDNPGWRLRVDLADTARADAPFTAVARGSLGAGLDRLSVERRRF